MEVDRPHRRGRVRAGIIPHLRRLAFTRLLLAEFPPPLRRTLNVDISAGLLGAAFVSLTTPFQGLILRRDFGATPFQLSLIAQAGAASLLLSLLWVRMGRARPPLTVVVWVSLAARALYLFTPLARSAWALAGILIAAAFLIPIAVPAQAEVVRRAYPRPQRGEALSMARIAGAGVGVALAPLAGKAIDLFGFRWVFPAAGLLGMAGSFRLRRLPLTHTPAVQPPGAGIRGSWAVVREDPAFRRLLAASFAFGFGVWMQMPANPIIVVDVLRATPGQLGLFAAIGAVAGIGANRMWGRLVDRRHSLGVLRLVYVVGAATPLLYLVARVPEVLALIAVADALVATGLDLVGIMVLLDTAGAERTAHYAAVSAVLTGVRGLLGPPLAVLVIRLLGVRYLYVVALAATLAAVWMITRQLRSSARAGAPPSR